MIIRFDSNRTKRLIQKELVRRFPGIKITHFMIRAGRTHVIYQDGPAWNTVRAFVSIFESKKFDSITDQDFEVIHWVTQDTQEITIARMDLLKTQYFPVPNVDADLVRLSSGYIRVSRDFTKEFLEHAISMYRLFILGKDNQPSPEIKYDPHCHNYYVDPEFPWQSDVPSVIPFSAYCSTLDAPADYTPIPI